MSSTWTNWARDQTGFPAETAHPSELAELVEVVKRAADRGRHVKAAGTGHGCSGIARTDGVLVHLDRYARVVGFDQPSSRVVVQAELNTELASTGSRCPTSATSTARPSAAPEHGAAATLRVGDRLLMTPGHVDPTVAMHDQLWPVDLRAW